MNKIKKNDIDTNQAIFITDRIWFTKNSISSIQYKPDDINAKPIQLLITSNLFYELIKVENDIALIYFMAATMSKYKLKLSYFIVGMLGVVFCTIMEVVMRHLGVR